jgi:hypothetical protein
MQATRLGLALLLITFFLANLALAAEDADFHFSVMGDNRPQGGQPDVITQNEFYRANIAEINRLDPDFVIVIGDLIMGYTPDKALLAKMWDAFDEANKLYTVPFRLCVGNHDVFDLQSQELYKERCGDLWYSFDHKGCHFIVLDSDYYAPDGSHFEGITGDQLDWLKADLEAHKDARRIYVFLHKPFWRYTDDQTNWNTQVHPLLAQYGVDTVFAGHWHQYEYDGLRDGVRYIVTGGAGAEIGQNPPMGDFYHHLFCTLRGDKTKIAVIESGKVLDEKVVTQEIRQAGEKLAAAVARDIHTLSPESTSASVGIAVENTYSEPMKARLVWETSGTGWRAEPSETTLDVGAGEKSQVPFLLTKAGTRTPGAGAPRYTVTCDIRGFRGPLNFENTVYIVPHAECLRVATPPEIDGSLTEWGEPAFHIGKGSAFEPPETELEWKGESDLSADIYLAWDDSEFYIAAKVTDDAFFNLATTPNTLYNGDSILIGLDTGRNCRDPENPNLGALDSDDVLLGAAILGGQPTAYCFLRNGGENQIEGLKSAVRTEGTETFYEIAVPWRSIGIEPSPGMEFGFCFRLNEDDTGGGREARVGWTVSSNPAAWGEVSLAP